MNRSFVLLLFLIILIGFSPAHYGSAMQTGTGSIVNHSSKRWSKALSTFSFRSGRGATLSTMNMNQLTEQPTPATADHQTPSNHLTLPDICIEGIASFYDETMEALNTVLSATGKKVENPVQPETPTLQPSTNLHKSFSILELPVPLELEMNQPGEPQINQVEVDEANQNVGKNKKGVKRVISKLFSRKSKFGTN